MPLNIRCTCLMAVLAFMATGFSLQSAETLPFDTVFVGEDRFQDLLAKAHEENWVDLPLGERTNRVGLALCGTPYKGFTLEIDDHIEAASVNFKGLDCWTFFEISLNFARMLKLPEKDQTPQTLLRLIENERYRNGTCTGSYVSRIHHLEELFEDNQRRGLLTNMTQSMGGVRIQREVREMTVGWKHYRYMVKNPDIRRQIEAMERRVTGMKVYHIPKSKVAAMEGQIKNGDIIAITSKYDGGYTSHVGLAYRDGDGVLHFMHASSNHKKVLVDVRLSEYLYDFSSHAGIVVARPNELPESQVVQIVQSTPASR